MGDPASVSVLVDRAVTLSRLASRLRSSRDQPAMQARVDDAASNLGLAEKWLSDPSLGDNRDALIWVDLLLTIAARRLDLLSAQPGA